MILPPEEVNTSNISQALDVVQNEKKKSINVAHTQKVWNRKDIIYGWWFCVYSATNLLNNGSKR